jgi:hypothetical protein
MNFSVFRTHHHCIHANCKWVGYTVVRRLQSCPSVWCTPRTESQLKIAQFKMAPHFRFTFVVSTKSPYKKCIIFLDLRFLNVWFFPHLRCENSVPTPFWSSIYASCLQLWSLDHLDNTMIVCSGMKQYQNSP